MNKIVIIDKAPSRNNYKNYFNFDFELFHMSSVPITKLLKKDVDLVIDLDKYDLVILVGSEATKEYAKITSVTNYAGQLMYDKYICISNPAMLHFKPEGKPDFQRSVDRIHKYIDGTITNASLTGKYLGISDTDKAIDFLKEVLDNAEGYVAMDTDDGRYTVFTDRGGYAWLAMPHKPTAAPTYLIITTSVNRFVDKVYNEDKGIRLTATVI